MKLSRQLGRLQAKQSNRMLRKYRKERRRMLHEHDRFWSGHIEVWMRSMTMKIGMNAMYGKFAAEEATP